MNTQEQPKKQRKKKLPVFVLHKHNGDYQSWNQLDESELNKWLNDGSIDHGDLIIYPNKILKAVSQKDIILIDEFNTPQADSSVTDQTITADKTGSGGGNSIRKQCTEELHKDYPGAD